MRKNYLVEKAYGGDRDGEVYVSPFCSREGIDRRDFVSWMEMGFNNELLCVFYVFKRSVDL